MMTLQTILLVEDNPDDEELTLRALRQNHVLNQIKVVHDGVEALEYLFGPAGGPALEVQDLPQVVLLDLNLPKMGGLEVLKRVRADPRTQFLPIVILTSSSEDEDIIASYRLGANSYVRKPVEFKYFSEAVQRLGCYWLLVNQFPPTPFNKA